MAGERLVKIMHDAAKNAIPKETLTDVLFGKVTSETPLKISIENRFEVGANFLVLSPFCIEFKSKDGVILWDGLKNGDRVNLLRFGNGQKFYVLDKGSD